MEFQELISKVKQYFHLAELVCPDVYNKYGEIAWTFFDPRLLETILVIREKLDRPIIVNNWHKEGQFTQRGLRCNQCDLMREKTFNDHIYMTAHAQGQALDFDVQGLSAEESRCSIMNLAEELPFNIRLEDNVSWIHLDVRDEGEKIYMFNI